MRLERATYRGREGGFPDIIDNFLYISEHTEIRGREMGNAGRETDIERRTSFGWFISLIGDKRFVMSFTFPNLILSRSILTVPWVELGGECNISCSKSGYSANIVFHTKPFYGGKKHRVTAEIL